MAAHSFITIGEHGLLACREGISESIAALFVEGDLRQGEHAYAYVTSAARMRQRLQLDGFSARQARTELDDAVRTWQNTGSSCPCSGCTDSYVDILRNRSTFDTQAAIEELRSYLTSPDPFEVFEEPEPFHWMDSRAHLRLALDLVTDETAVAYDLRELISWGFYRTDAAITDHARSERERDQARNSSLVVITEGSTDARVLAAGMRITHPHLVGLLRFLDFDGTKVDGGAAALARTVWSFAAAGIANRVVALADNDTAAYDALANLKTRTLPDHYRVLHYPDLPLLEAYPTLGPQSPGPVLVNVNGTAGSLEMYLGRNLLTVDGELVPVLWGAPIPHLDKFQGALAKQHKERVRRQFLDTAKRSETDQAARAAHDWSGIHSIIEAVVNAFN